MRFPRMSRCCKLTSPSKESPINSVIWLYSRRRILRLANALKGALGGNSTRSLSCRPKISTFGKPSNAPWGSTRNGWRRIDSLPVEVHGEQPGSAWNGYYHRRVYQIVAAAGETGDILDLRLREGQVHNGGLECWSGRSGIWREGRRALRRGISRRAADGGAGGAGHALPDHSDSQTIQSARRLERPRTHYCRRRRCPARTSWRCTRKRGKAEGHLGELMSVVAPALSSTCKSHYQEAQKGVDAFACKLYQIMHVQPLTGTGWSLRRLAETPRRASPSRAAIIGEAI